MKTYPILTTLTLSVLLTTGAACNRATVQSTATPADQHYVHPPQSVRNVEPTQEDVAWATQFQSVSGPGKPVVGKGRGGWVSGTSGVRYSGPDPRPEYRQDNGICNGRADDAFTVKELHCRNQLGQDIFGQLYLPNSSNAEKPLAILAHGYNSSIREVDVYARVLARKGIACYAFEFCGGAVNSRSEGSTLKMSVFTEADDVAAVYRTAKTWDFVDPARISLLGCSQGGLVAAIASSQMPDAFRSVVLVYPALMIGEDAVNRHPKEALTSETGANVMGMPLSHVYYDKLVGYHIYDELPKYKKDVMIVYGDKDPIAAGSSIERARKEYTRCEVHEIAGGSHGFPEPAAHSEAEKFIADFLSRTLL